MNKRGLLFISILLILVSSGYAVQSCDTVCKNQGDERGECTQYNMGSGWTMKGIGPCRDIDPSLVCWCKNKYVSPPPPPPPPPTKTQPPNYPIYYTLQGLSTGKYTCEQQGGNCQFVQCLLSKPEIDRWGSCGMEKGTMTPVTCSTQSNKISSSTIRAKCSCSTTQKYCKGNSIYQRRDDCYENYVEDCKDKICKNGGCVGIPKTLVEITGIDVVPAGAVNLDTDPNFIVKCESSVSDVNFVEAKLDNAQCIFVEGSWQDSKASFTCSSTTDIAKTAKCTINEQKITAQNQPYRKTGTDKTKQVTFTKTIPAGEASTCGNSIVEGAEKCDCGDPTTRDIGCEQNELGEYKSCSSVPSATYPNAKLSCYPPTSSKKCTYNTQGCDNNRIPCFIDLECNSGEGCHPTEYYCYLPASTCGDGRVEGVEKCDCGTDNECTAEELKRKKIECDTNTNYPDKKVSCFPSTSLLKCTLNMQGCNSGYTVCLKDSDCLSGEYCDLQDYYCRRSGGVAGCKLISSDIQLQGTDNIADPGDKIKIIATTENCPTAKKIQIDASETGDDNGQCVIKHIGGKISGINGDLTSQSMEWTIPGTIPPECQGKTIIPYAVGLYSGEIISDNYIRALVMTPTGSFTFASDGGAQNCGDGTKDAEEICDKQLTPTKSCTSIDPNLYSGGEAACNRDCTGWDTTNCVLNEITTGCGNGVFEPDLGEQCDCGNPATRDIGCDQNELGEYKSCSSVPGATYPSAKLSCFPPGSSYQCNYNVAGCNYNKVPCFIDAECNHGEKCHPTDYYCYVPPPGTPPCTPQCPDPTTINCGTTDTRTNGCGGNCNVVGTKCTTGTCQSGQCVQQISIVCGVGPIYSGCQCPEGTQRTSGYCCKNAQNNFVYSPDVPCGQEGLNTEGRTLASFKYDKEGATVNFISTSIPLQGTVINYYGWDFGDSSTPIGGQGYKEITHTYQFDGSEKTFLVSLLVHDNKAGVDQWSMSIKITKDISDLPDTEKCNDRGLEKCHTPLDGCFFDSECKSCRVVSKCGDFSDDELACTGEIPGCDRYACDWDNFCLPKQVSEQDCQYVCIDLTDESVGGYYFNGIKEYPQTCEKGTCWECPTEGCKFISPDGETTITYIDGECVNGFKEVKKITKYKSLPQEEITLPPQPCSVSPVISFFTLLNIILTLSILTIFYLFRKKF